MHGDNIIELCDLSIDYPLKKYTLHAVSDCSLEIKRSAITALVGESGSGKTTLASSIIQCLSEPGRVVNGTIRMKDSADGEPIAVEQLSEKELSKLRWDRISMVFQAAQSSFNPIMTIWEHFWETYHTHRPQAAKAEALEKTRELLDYVKLDVDRVLKAYPHELSGGMKQRTAIAFAMLLDPDMIILDEPTTALDVITQRYIFDILRKIKEDTGVSMLLMTHDINVVAQFSDYVGVMYAGRIMEYGKTKEVFSSPRHPYTKGLLQATPSLSCDLSELKPIPGSPPDLRYLREGCKFCDRCSFATERCFRQEPETRVIAGRMYKCHLAEEAGPCR